MTDGVFNDMLREAAETGLLTLAMLVVAVINAITYLRVVLAGSSLYRHRVASIRWFFEAVRELLRMSAPSALDLESRRTEALDARYRKVSRNGLRRHPSWSEIVG